LNAAHRNLAMLAMHTAAEHADLRAGPVSAGQQLHRAERCFLGPVFLFDPMAPACFAQVLTQ